jgi:hypothetical protein
MVEAGEGGTRMMKFAEAFPDEEIVATLSQQLSWSHFRELLPLVAWIAMWRKSLGQSKRGSDGRRRIKSEIISGDRPAVIVDHDR